MSIGLGIATMSSLINLLRTLLPRPIKQAFKKLFGLPEARLHADWSILNGIGPVAEHHVVLDLGARNGWFFSNWKAWCKSAEIYAFEPDLAAYEKLVQRYKSDSSIHISQYGIGEEQGIEKFYYMAGSEVSSSFLKHNTQVWDQLKYDTGEVEQRELKITTVDKYTEKHRIEAVFLIKIDIQGYEMRALRGADKTLLNTSYVLVESSIQPLYQDASSFTEVHDYLVSNGFHLINWRAWHRGNEVLMETDMLFRKNELAPDVDEHSNFDRKYI